MAELERLNWDALEWEDVNPHMKRKIITGDLMTVAKIALKDGFTVPLHSHINEQITQVISGKMQFRFGDNGEEEMILGPGDVVVIAGKGHEDYQIIGTTRSDFDDRVHARAALASLGWESAS